MVSDPHTMIIEQTPDQVIHSELYQYHLAAQDKPLVITLVGAGGKTTTAFWLARLFKQWGNAVCLTTTTKMYLPDSNQADHVIPIEAIYDNRTDNRHRDFAAPNITFCYRTLLPDNQKNGKCKVTGVNENDLSRLKNHMPFTVFIIEGDGSRSLPIKAPHRHEPCIPSYSDMVIGVTGAEAINRRALPEQIHHWPAFSALTQCQQGQEVDAQVLHTLINQPLGLFKSCPATAKQIWLINKIDQANNSQRLQQTAAEVLAASPRLAAVWLAKMHAETPIKNVILKEQVAVAT